jgi:quinol monooxygenase YgiN
LDRKFGLVVKFVLKAGHEDSFDNSVREMLSAVRDHEPGNLVFACHTVDGRPELRVFYELYTDRAAFDAHGAQPHTCRFLAERDQHVDHLEADFLELTYGKGV